MIRGEVTISPGFVANSNGRARTAIRYGERGGLGVEDCKRLLSSHEDPHVPGALRAAGSVVSQPMTIKSIVVDHDRGVLHMGVGRTPAGEGPWVEVPLDWSASAGHRAITSEPAGPVDIQRRGAQAFVEAVRLQQGAGADRDVSANLRRATILCPEEAGFHHLAGAYALKEGSLRAAEAHFERALEYERAPFYRGEALLWAARTAQALGEKAQARELREELLVMPDPLLERHRRDAASDGRQDYTLARLKRVSVVPHLVEARLI